MICDQCGCEFGGDECPECFWDEYEYRVIREETEEWDD